MSGALGVLPCDNLEPVAEDQDGGGLGKALASGVTSALAQLSLGAGPLGVLAGTFAPVGVQGASVVAARILRRQAEKVGQTLEVAASILDVGIDIFDERLPGHDERVELLARVIEGAARSTIDEKVLALGRVLAQGLSDDGDADEALILAAALAVLEGPHVVVLQHLGTHPEPPRDYLRPGIDSTLGCEIHHLARALPGLADVLDGLIAVLAGQGLVRDVSGTTTGTIGPRLWAITPLGRRCLFLLGR